MLRQSLYFTEANRVEILEEPVPAIGANQVLVATVVSAISAGTELLFYRDQVPASMSIDEGIEALGQAEIKRPLKYGYAAVGRVVEIGSSVDPRWRGQRVFAFNPHETHFVASVEDLVPLPESLDSDAAALLPTMETAVSLIQDARPEIGEQVAIFGLGMVGLLCTKLLAEMPLGRLVGVDSHAARRERAIALGASAAIDATSQRVATETRAALRSRGTEEGEAYEGADLTLELSGNPAALEEALRVVGYSGRIVVGSWYGTKRIALDAMGERFHRDHVRIQSSQVSRIDPRLMGRWTKSRRLRTAMDALQHVDAEQFVTQRLPLSQAGDAFELLDTRPETALQVLVTYPAS